MSAHNISCCKEIRKKISILVEKSALSGAMLEKEKQLNSLKES